MVVPLPFRPMSARRPFLVGKMPAHGDFVSRGLERVQEVIWDSWAAGEIERAQDLLGDRFERGHLGAPPLRLITGPGPLGGTWIAGAIAASVDGVGRRFLLAAGLGGLTPQDALGVGPDLAARVEALLYRVLRERLPADEAVAQLAAFESDSGVTTPLQALGGAPEAPGVWWSYDAPDLLELGSSPPVGLYARLMHLAASEGTSAT